MRFTFVFELGEATDRHVASVLGTRHKTSILFDNAFLIDDYFGSYVLNSLMNMIFFGPYEFAS